MKIITITIVLVMLSNAESCKKAPNNAQIYRGEYKVSSQFKIFARNALGLRLLCGGVGVGPPGDRSTQGIYNTYTEGNAIPATACALG
jgi:hypothetical protein